ncbi:hypothetical protein QK416_23390, partial [Pseudomonas aeruginosa]|nr:hypothetical protein [Pseudomonas aeruginosa]
MPAEQQLVLDVREANFLYFRQGGQIYDLDIAQDDLQIMENTTPWGRWCPPDGYAMCSGQPIPDSGLSFSSATAGGNPSLN